MEDFMEIIAIGISSTMFFAVILGFIAYMRYLRYKENIELARHGITRQSVQRNGRRTDKNTRRGIIMFAIGTMLTCGLSTIGLESGPILGPWLLGGLIPMGFGASLIAISYLDRRNDEDTIRVNHKDVGDDEIPPHKLNL